MTSDVRRHMKRVYYNTLFTLRGLIFIIFIHLQPSVCPAGSYPNIFSWTTWAFCSSAVLTVHFPLSQAALHTKTNIVILLVLTDPYCNAPLWKLSSCTQHLWTLYHLPPYLHCSPLSHTSSVCLQLCFFISFISLCAIFFMFLTASQLGAISSCLLLTCSCSYACLKIFTSFTAFSVRLACRAELWR